MSAPAARAASMPAPAGVAGPACMRWSPGRVQSWRRAEDGGFDPGRYGVAPIGYSDARRFCLDVHYSGSYPADRQRYGLFDLSGGDRLVGVAVLSVPTRPEVLTGVFPRLVPYEESLDLGRFCLLDQPCPANSESWFLGQVFRLAAATGIRGLTSFSDPMPRYDTNGNLYKPGHIGLIYQCTNARYTGRGTPRTLVMLRNGEVLSARALQKVRGQERGHEYVERLLIAHGARAPRAGENPAAWLRQALPDARVLRVRHGGNHRYAFTLGCNRRERAAVEVAIPGRAYPKTPDHGPQMELDLLDACDQEPQQPVPQAGAHCQQAMTPPTPRRRPTTEEGNTK